MNLGGSYKTLKGDIGEVVAASSLNHELKDDFNFEEKVILCQLIFGDGKYEWWLNTHLEEVESPQLDLFKEVTD